MAEQPTGSDMPYVAENPSGIGAVFFDKAPDLLSIHMKNLEEIDKGLGEKQKQKEAATKVLGTLLADKNPKIDGIFPQDTPYLRDLGSDVIKKQAQLAGYGTPNFSDPNYVDLYTQYKESKNKLEGMISASKSFNKDVTKIGDIFATGQGKDKYDEATFASEFGKARQMHPEERYSQNGVSPSTWLKEREPELGEIFQNAAKQIVKPIKMTSENLPTTFGGRFMSKEHGENFTPEQGEAVINQIESGLLPHSKQALDKAWAAVSPSVMKVYKDKYALNGVADDLAESMAKKDWAKDQFMHQYHRELTNYKLGAETAEAKMYEKAHAAENKLAQEGAWVNDLTAGITAKNTDQLTKTPYESVTGKKMEFMATTALNGITKLKPYNEPLINPETGKQAVDMNGAPMSKQMPNSILLAGKDPATGVYFLITNQSRSKAQQTGLMKDEIEQFSTPTELRDRIADLAGGKARAGAYEAAKQRKAGDSYGNFDPDAWVGVSTAKQKADAEAKSNAKVVTVHLGEKPKIKLISVILDGKEGQIPEDKWADFIKKYPTAKRK